uniref:Secreted protein n=1 Tax=Setaria viridis TaxID=4556 RepID=A0A4U6UE25_SETVI|nr:hypothetical protein SEVIR_6G038250v2 [Setaria viridis]
MMCCCFNLRSHLIFCLSWRTGCVPLQNLNLNFKRHPAGPESRCGPNPCCAVAPKGTTGRTAYSDPVRRETQNFFYFYIFFSDFS